jgi:hypothetical protein
VSDASIDELHAFAAQLGLDPRLFDGDHYDIPADAHGRAVELGAVAVEGRELVRRLRASGLRLSPAQRRSAKGRQLGRQVATGRGVEGSVGPVGGEAPGPVEEPLQHR